MPSDSVQKGIAAIQSGKPKEGKRLIKYGLKNDQMTKHERVSALVWLAETDTNPQFKVEQYQQAIQLDPSNQDVIRRLNYWMDQVQQAPQQPAPQQNPPMPNQPQQQQNNQQQWNAAQSNQQNPQQQSDSQQWNAGQFNQQNPQQQQPNQANPQGQQWNQQQSDSQQWNAGGFNQQIQGDSQQWNPNNISNRPNAGTDQFNTLIQGDSQRWDTQNVNQRGSSGQFDPQSLNNLNDSQQSQRNQPPQQQNWQQWNQQQINNLSDTGSFQAQNNWQSGGTSQQMPVQNQKIQLQQVQRTVGITGGSGGAGTGFFITLDGIVATTRHIVGGARDVTIQLLDGRSIRGQVVRAFPAFDLALIQTNVKLIRLMNVLQQPNIPDNATMVAVSHSGQGLRTAKRRSANNIGAHWFPTLINKLMDEGGNPMFNERNVLVGMLTKNASRASGYMYGLHIHKIYECVDQYVYEKGQVADRQTIYCNSCGIISVAPTYQGYFCEHCGIKHPYIEDNRLEPQPSLAGLYGENDRPCQNCGSQVGIYNGACMRCGAEIV